ncbi:MAG: hypothetical protein JRH13_10305 [Deltaproteobacteria bacterium]|nr:hypothetical protein [Deltaproteobacteria bacterium]MBW2016190.1 hypothetical protein [Deltaproteobacteria bacterium]MBW2129744.1 hypothetical protein [Deltaproteobacteria bacterium]MBW2302693.1 hypothetical protein [Deltaproteobacteria bacterium]
MLYVIRIFHVLREDAGEGKHPLKTGEEKEEKGKWTAWAIPLLVVFLGLLFGLLEYGLLSLAKEGVVHSKGVTRISLFYIRICGVFWILFEWVVAVYGIRAYFLLKRIMEGKHV